MLKIKGDILSWKTSNQGGLSLPCQLQNLQFTTATGHPCTIPHGKGSEMWIGLPYSLLTASPRLHWGGRQPRKLGSGSRNIRTEHPLITTKHCQASHNIKPPEDQRFGNTLSHRMKEAVAIKQRKPPLNRDEGLALPAMTHETTRAHMICADLRWPPFRWRQPRDSVEIF